MSNLSSYIDDVYWRIGPLFGLQAANNNERNFSGHALRSTVFEVEELLALREALYPYGGAIQLSEYRFKGASHSGEQVELFVSGQGVEGHILTLTKLPHPAKNNQYSIILPESGAELQQAQFGSALETVQRTLRGMAKDACLLPSRQP